LQPCSKQAACNPLTRRDCCETKAAAVLTAENAGIFEEKQLG